MSRPLDNPRREAYCRARAAGKTQRQAMLEAWPTRAKWKPETVDNRAYVLEKDDEVKARIEALLADAAARSSITRAQVLDGMGETFKRALSAEQMNQTTVTAVSQIGRTLLSALPTEHDDTITGTTWNPALRLPAAYVDVYRDIMAGGHSEYIFLGGRGSLKSSNAYATAIDIMRADPRACGVCFRRVANTLRDSCLAGLVREAARYGLEDEFESGVSPLHFTRRTSGQTVFFRGVDDKGKDKSLTLPNPNMYLAFAIWEEWDQQRGIVTVDATGAKAVSVPDVRRIEQTIIRDGVGHFTTIRVFNPPPDAEHWANVYAAEREAEPRTLVHRSSYLDVPAAWLGDEFIAGAERLRTSENEAMRSAYLNEYKGETIELEGRVFGNVVDATITDEMIETLRWRRNGVDWGFAPDPFVFLRIAYDRKHRTLHIYDEYWAVRQRNIDTARELKRRMARPQTTDGTEQLVFKRGLAQNECRCDIAEKKSIADFQAYGINAQGASKKVPVTTGIKWLAEREAIVIDRKRCPLAYQEFTRYRRLEDDEGHFAGYPDKDNHSIDACRYAVFDIIGDVRET